MKIKSLSTVQILRVFAACLLFGVAVSDVRQLPAAEIAGAGIAAETVAKKPNAWRRSVASDELGRNTPRGTIDGFLAAAKARNDERAAQYLDLSDRRPEDIATEGPQLAKSLFIVLETKVWFDPQAASDSLDGNLDDGLPADQEMLGRVDAPGKSFDLVLERISEGKGVPVWKISRATVDDAPDMARRLSYGLLGKYMPLSFFEIKFLDITLAEWLFFLIVLLLSASFFWIVLRLLTRLARKFRNEYLSSLIEYVRWPLWALASAFLIRAVFNVTAFSALTQAILKAQTGIYIFGVWFIMRLIDFFISSAELNLRQGGRPESAILIKFSSKIIKTCIVLAALTLWLENIGIKVSTLLAGIGIGGIAFALAAQKSIEDLFGAITLIGYRPFKIGEMIHFGEKVGMVEEIGVRYTRVRTLDRTALNIPNGQLASMPIENLTRRNMFRYLNVIDLGYETTPDQLRYILRELRTLLYSDARVASDPACWARFKEFGAYSLKVEISAWVRTHEASKYREIAEDLNFKIMELVRAAGASFAFPTQVHYEQAQAPINQDLVSKAEAQVRKWQAEGNLFMDEFPPEEIARLRQGHKK